MDTCLKPFTTMWQQHTGNGNFVWVRSIAGTQRVSADGHFMVTILANHRDDGLVEHRIHIQTDEEYTPDMLDEWREDVVTPAVARERATLIIEACDEIDRREANEQGWVRGGPPTAGGSQWGEAHVEAHVEAIRRLDEEDRRAGG